MFTSWLQIWSQLRPRLSFKIGWLGIGALLGMASIAFGVWLLFQSGQSLGISAAESPRISGLDPQLQIAVDIRGAVMQPGVYQLDSNARLAQAIEAAGGFIPTADKKFITQEMNLAENLKDGQKLYIPYQDEFKLSALTSTATSTSSTYLTAKISINTATQSELESLEGIGEKKAEQIIAGRPYSSLAELVAEKILSENLLTQLNGVLSL